MTAIPSAVVKSRGQQESQPNTRRGLCWRTAEVAGSGQSPTTSPRWPGSGAGRWISGFPVPESLDSAFSLGSPPHPWGRKGDSSTPGRRQARPPAAALQDPQSSERRRSRQTACVNFGSALARTRESVDLAAPPGLAGCRWRRVRPTPHGRQPRRRDRVIGKAPRVSALRGGSAARSQWLLGGQRLQQARGWRHGDHHRSTGSARNADNKRGERLRLLHPERRNVRTASTRRFCSGDSSRSSLVKICET
jgi:hypothetical protein